MSDNGVQKVIIIGSGPAAHTAAIYAGRAELAPLMFEGFMAGGVAAGSGYIPPSGKKTCISGQFPYLLVSLYAEKGVGANAP